jgi:hypothetical protein
LVRFLAAPLSLAAVIWLAGSGVVARATASPEPNPVVVGPTQILFADADTVFLLRSREWWSDHVREQEKLLLHNLRIQYWRDHLPADMRLVFERLGYPSGRVMLTPIGHTEEWWYYSQLEPPLRFRDGALLDWDRFEHYLPHP